jgi:hypothetical protein
MIAQSILTVKPGCIRIGAQQRLLRSNVDWNLGSAKFNGVQGVTRRLLNVHIACNHRDRSHPDIGGSQGHDERNSIVGSSVGID